MILGLLRIYPICLTSNVATGKWGKFFGTEVARVLFLELAMGFYYFLWWVLVWIIRVPSRLGLGVLNFSWSLVLFHHDTIWVLEVPHRQHHHTL